MSVLEQRFEQQVAHNKKYENLPLNKRPNFYLGRPLTKYEHECLRLIAVCNCKSVSEYKNFMDSMSLSGYIPNFVKDCEQAYKDGYYVFAETSVETIKHRIDGLEEFVASVGKPITVPFPPKKTMWGAKVVTKWSR